MYRFLNVKSTTSDHLHKFLVGTTREHLGLAMALTVPVFIVVSKVDLCTKATVERTVRQLERFLKQPGCNKIPLVVNSKDDAVTAAQQFVQSPRYKVLLNIPTALRSYTTDFAVLRRFLNCLLLSSCSLRCVSLIYIGITLLICLASHQSSRCPAYQGKIWSCSRCSLTSCLPSATAKSRRSSCSNSPSSRFT